MGASTIPSTYLLPELLPAYKKLCPETYFNIYQSDSQGIVDGLLQGNFDLYYGEVRLSPNFDLSPFFGATGTLNYGSLSDSTMMNLCSMALVNSGNTYNLYKRVCERGYITPILFKSYALYTTRGAVTEPTHYIDWFLPYTPAEGN